MVLGGGDLASGVIYRLARSGFRPVVLELARPLLLRRPVCFGDAIYQGRVSIEGIEAQKLIIEQRADGARQIQDLHAKGIIPVVVDEQSEMIDWYQPDIVIDARMCKKNLGINRSKAALVIGMGPGFTAGEDCHAVIETNRGHYLGRIYYEGTAEADTGIPGEVSGQGKARVLRAPADGYVISPFMIGDMIPKDEVIAQVNDGVIVAPFDGVLRGLIHPSVFVSKGLKVGDLDPRGNPEHCFSISDKSLSVGGAVLEAILSSALLHSVTI